jgi:hypothetical protein
VLNVIRFDHVRAVEVWSDRRNEIGYTWRLQLEQTIERSQLSPLTVPGELFSSTTVYDAQTRSEISTEQNMAALRSLFELSRAGDAGSVDLFFGPEQPRGADGRWIMTLAGSGWLFTSAFTDPTPLRSTAPGNHPTTNPPARGR